MKRLQIIFGACLALTVFNVCLWFLSTMFWNDSHVRNPFPNNSEIVDIVSQERDHGQHGILGDIDSGMLSGMSSPSLRMKENVDFFLTPALLVQECISENVIITYPGE